MPEQSENHSLEKLDGAVPATHLQGEVVPASKGNPPDERRRLRRRNIVAVGFVLLLSFIFFFISNFLQLRGVINVTASRIFLYIATALLIVIIWMIRFNLKRRHVTFGAVAVSLAVGFLAYRVDITTLPHKPPVSRIYDDEEAQLEILNPTPEQTAEFDKIRAPLFRIKSEMLDTPSYPKLVAAKEQLRQRIESIEVKYRCSVDAIRLVCLPKPPSNLSVSVRVDIAVSFSLVENELLDGVKLWVVHNNISKLEVPVALFVSLTNLTDTPMKISVFYLEAKSVNGWTDVRIADSLYKNPETEMTKRPLLFCAKNGCVHMKGDYLLPSLYDRVIQPKERSEGWVIAEYPKGVKYGSSVKDMRISLAANKRWIGSKSFTANPPTYGNRLKVKVDDFYFIPLDTLITEQQ